MPDTTPGHLDIADTKVSAVIGAAQALLATSGMAGLAAAGASNPLSAKIHDSLSQHANAVIALGQQWRRQFPVMKVAVASAVAAAEALRAVTGETPVAAIKASIVAMGASIQQETALLDFVRGFGDQLATLRGELSGDAAAVASEIQADSTHLTDLQNQLRQFYADHSGSKYACEEAGKAIVSFGGWAIADAVNAQKAANDLNQSIGALQAELPALGSVEHPVEDLAASVGALVDAASGLLASAQEVVNAASTIEDQSNKVNADSFWFRAQLSAMDASLSDFVAFARTLASSEDVCGGYCFPSLGLVWRNVPDAELCETFSPPLSTDQLNDFKWWSQAAARWGLKFGQGTYFMAVPTFEVGTVNGVPVRGVVLFPNTLGVTGRDVADTELLALFPPNFLKPEDLDNPRYWAAAINRYALSQRDAQGRPFAMGLPTWEVGSDGQPVRGAVLIPQGQGIEWQDIPTAELAVTFAPPLTADEVQRCRYWAAATCRWSSPRYAFAVPTWEVGSKPI